MVARRGVAPVAWGGGGGVEEDQCEVEKLAAQLIWFGVGHRIGLCGATGTAATLCHGGGSPVRQGGDGRLGSFSGARGFRSRGQLEPG